MTEKKTAPEPMRNIAPFGLRMQPDLREKVELASNKSGRSMNAEIIHRLEGSFEAEEFADGGFVDRYVKEIIRVSMRTWTEGLLERLLKADDPMIAIKAMLPEGTQDEEIYTIMTKFQKGEPYKSGPPLTVARTRGLDLGDDE